MPWYERKHTSWIGKPDFLLGIQMMNYLEVGIMYDKQTPSFNSTRDNSTQGHHQMVNTKIRSIIFFAAKDGEALYRQQKQDWKQTVAQIMNSLLQN